MDLRRILHELQHKEPTIWQLLENVLLGEQHQRFACRGAGDVELVGDFLCAQMSTQGQLACLDFLPDFSGDA
ncbi:hypothetical protein D3C76_1173180 [compost metagenome]